MSTTTRARLQELGLDELRTMATTVEVEPDGLQKSKLIAAILKSEKFDPSMVPETEEDGDAPATATPRSDNGQGSNSQGQQGQQSQKSHQGQQNQQGQQKDYSQAAHEAAAAVRRAKQGTVDDDELNRLATEAADAIMRIEQSAGGGGDDDFIKPIETKRHPVSEQQRRGHGQEGRNMGLLPKDEKDFNSHDKIAAGLKARGIGTN